MKKIDKTFISIILTTAFLGSTVGGLSGISSAEVTIPIIGGLISLLSGLFLVKINDLDSVAISKLASAIIFFCLSLMVSLGIGISFRLKYFSDHPAASALLKSSGPVSESQADILCRSSNINALEKLCAAKN